LGEDIAVMTKSLSIGGAVTSLIAILILRFQNIINDDHLVVAAVVLAMATGSLLISWFVTEYYKRVKFSTSQIQKINTPGAIGVDPQKRDTYRMATWSGFIAMMVNGVVFDLLTSLDTRIRVVMWILWVIFSIIVGFMSPWLWRFTFTRLGVIK
jgi:hypothetical protein